MSQPQPVEIVHEFPEKLAILRQPSRYKVLYGGRGGMKSWGIARQLLLDSYERKLLTLCTREIQKSVEESVYRLLCNQIEAMQLSDFYDIQKTKITGRNGSEFVFAGLRHNMNNLKSFEGADRVWVEEAVTVSKASWEKLTPTIRVAGSEIWMSFNPDLEEDYTYQHFVTDPPPDSQVLKIGWQDNPWFPDVLRQEMEDCKRRDYKNYLHIWEGQCKQAVEGAIFANELQKANEEHRITRVAVQPGIPVFTFWDLGESDNTAIWFAQIVGMEYRMIDYYQCNRQKMSHYVEVLAKRGYMYGDHYLPHDADHEQLAAQSTIKAQLRKAITDNPALGKLVYVVPRIAKKSLAIDAARTIFDQCLFDKENTSDGLQCLRHSRYATNEETGRISKEPMHDIWSHGADAFMCMAQHFKKPSLIAKKPDPYKRQASGGSWMSS
jgi:phage terminase large subunit